MKKLNCRLTKTESSGLFHDSRKDIHTITTVFNELHDKVNEIVNHINKETPIPGKTGRKVKIHSHNHYSEGVYHGIFDMKGKPHYFIEDEFTGQMNWLSVDNYQIEFKK